ncbi:MAG: M23 family metallopeptidase [Treponema sp.]|jgi:murein DD-endopeptidase MepM/ murein hydrolase activator NlpD|nr:M23 family metallopeptidase [Treponema sp.]
MRFFAENGRIIFRLVLAVFLIFALKPNLEKKQQGKPDAYGVGGEVIPEKIIINEEMAFEDVILEPEAFSRPRVLIYDAYVVKKGDMIGKLAIEFGLNQDTLISVNAIKNTRLLQEKQILKIPNQDGILYPVQSGDTLNSIAEKNKSDPQAIQIANELFSENVKAGTSLFIPGGRLDWMNLQEINGDLFLWPVFGSITSYYGYRNDPFTGSRSFHSGLDISARMGSPVRAAMAGRVSTVGYDDVRGNYVVISHHSGYRTLYGHMSVIRTKTGAYVGTLEQIGDVGSTGQSTGPHVHFTVYKDGVTVNPRTLMK